MRSALLLGLVLAGCKQDVALDFSSPWDPNELAVVVLATPEGLPLLPQPIVAPAGQRIVLDFAYEQDFVVWAESYPPDRIAPNGARYEDCDFVFAGDGNEVATPSRRFFAGPFTPEPEGSVDFIEQPTSMARPFPLHHQRCAANIGPCEGLRLTTFPLDQLGRLRVVSAIDEQRAIVAGDADAGGMLIGRFERDHFEPFARAFNGSPDSIAWRSGEVWGIGGRPVGGHGNVWRVDETGAPLPSITADIDGTQRFVAACADGSTFMSGTESGLFELPTPTSSIARSDHPWRPRRFYAVDRNRMVVVDATTERVLRYFDGDNWLAEWNRGISTMDPQSFAGDASHLVMVGSPDIVKMRDESSREWEALPNWPRGINGDPEGVALLFGPRIVVAGSEIGGIAVGTTDRWCNLEGLEPRHYSAVTASPSGRVVWAVGYTMELPATYHSVIVKIELSD